MTTWQDSGLSSGVGHHQRDAFLVGAIHHSLGLQMTLLFRRFVIEKVIMKGAATHELASACCFEPFGGCFAGLELGHGRRIQQQVLESQSFHRTPRQQWMHMEEL
jgi:hypothetical protein